MLFRSSPVSYCGFAINAGTRDEAETQLGMAHFVEHMIFKGTPKRKSLDIINRMESVGGELNAYTTKEETTVYSVFLEEDFKRAANLLCDLICNSTFPENELEKEVDVIIDEINSYRDNPPEFIYDEFEDALFKKHNLGHNILGTEDMLKSFNSRSGCDFLSTYYRPDNMIFFSLGKTDFKIVISELEKNLSFNTSPSPARLKRIAPQPHDKFKIELDQDTNQGHVIIGNRCFDMFNPKRASLAILNNILGGPGMNSRLNISLREKKGLVYNIESNLSMYTDTGVFSIYFGTDQEDIDKCISLVNKELKHFRDVSLTSSQLDAAKKQIKGQISISNDNKESVAMGMAKSFLHYNKYDSLDEVFEKIQDVTPSDILETANIVFDEKSISSIIIR